MFFFSFSSELAHAVAMAFNQFETHQIIKKMISSCSHISERASETTAAVAAAAITAAVVVSNN